MRGIARGRTRRFVPGVVIFGLMLVACEGGQSSPDVTSPSGQAVQTPSEVSTSMPVFVMGSATSPRVSPDGQRVVFSVETESGGFDLVATDINGKTVEVLTDGPEIDLDPVWSPDGQTIAFNASPDGPPTLFSIPAAGGEPTPVKAGTDELPYGIFQTYSPSGTEMAYACSGEVLEDIDICIVDVGTGETENITKTPGVMEWEPSYSPDGSHIAYSSNQDDDAFDIWRMKVDGSERRNLTPGTEGSRQADPMYSPDGSLIAFDTGAVICTFTPLGKNPMCLSDVNAVYPGWTPDGKQFVFYSHLPDGTTAISIMDIDGTHVKQLFPPTSGGIEPA